MFFSPDGNDESKAIPQMISKISEGFDIVHISRFGKGSYSEDAGIIDNFGNRMFTFLVNVFFGGIIVMHLTDLELLEGILC